MNQEYYKLLGVTEQNTDEEIRQRYLELKAKYSEERWQDGEKGTEAAKMLNKIEVAYQEIVSDREQRGKQDSGESAFGKVEAFLREGKLKEAQDALDDFNERNAQWHYLQAAVFYKKQWMNESKKQLEIAMQMDPSNEKYKKEYEKFIADNGRRNEQQGGSYRYDAETSNDDADQMGGSGCTECMSWCVNCLCLNAVINLCCGCR